MIKQSTHSISLYRKRRAFYVLCGLVLFISALVPASHAGIATVTQSIELQPGWNAVYVEIEPENNDIETIFSGIPVASVWRWIPEKLGSDFLVNPAEGLMNLEDGMAIFRSLNRKRFYRIYTHYLPIPPILLS